MIPNQSDRHSRPTTNTTPMSKTRHHINYGPAVVTLLFQSTEHFIGTVATAYVDNCSIRSHHLQNDAVRESFIEGVCALVGGADNEFRTNLDDIITSSI